MQYISDETLNLGIKYRYIALNEPTSHCTLSKR